MFSYSKCYIIIFNFTQLPVKTQQTISLGRCCSVRAQLVGFLRLSRAGYSPGETIHILADIENFNLVNITHVGFTLYKVSISCYSDFTLLLSGWVAFFLTIFTINLTPDYP